MPLESFVKYQSPVVKLVTGSYFGEVLFVKNNGEAMSSAENTFNNVLFMSKIKNQINNVIKLSLVESIVFDVICTVGVGTIFDIHRSCQ